MISGKVETFSKQNSICKRHLFIMRVLYTKLQSYGLCYRQTSGKCRRHLLLQGLYVPSAKTTTYVCNSFNASFCTKDCKTHLAISCYTLLHRAASREGKNSLRKSRDILVSDRYQQRFLIIIIT